MLLKNALSFFWQSVLQTSDIVAIVLCFLYCSNRRKKENILALREYYMIDQSGRGVRL